MARIFTFSGAAKSYAVYQTIGEGPFKAILLLQKVGEWQLCVICVEWNVIKKISRKKRLWVKRTFQVLVGLNLGFEIPEGELQEFDYPSLVQKTDVLFVEDVFF